MTTAIIVAAGSGVRMQDAMRKQYMLISDIPILGHTLLVFDACDMIDTIILVIPKGDMNYCSRTILPPLKLHKKIRLVEGGSERCDSVYNGLMTVDPETRIVVIHDGVRPFIRPDQIHDCIIEAEKSGACILGIHAFDTVKCVDHRGNIKKTIGRNNIQLAQTPQAFKRDLILKAHVKAKKEGFISNDDAQLVERLGEKVKVITGSRLNIKITDKEDLKLAAVLLKVIS
jgi:2-C-methyl-D-erythritol 4-phosphate cytidylyltransferase